MKTKKITGRIASIVLAIVLLLTVLVGCAGKTEAPTLSFNKDKFQMNTTEEMNAHGLTPNELTKVAEIFSAALVQRLRLMLARLWLLPTAVMT